MINTDDGQFLVKLARSAIETYLNDGRIINAVSYTHLDVYKRQSMDGLRIPPGKIILLSR